MKYAFIGLGELGANLAANLCKAGFSLYVNDLDRSRAAQLEAAGANWCATPAEAAHEADATITCLPSPSVTQAVLTEILPQMRKGSSWIEMSTLGREEILRFAQQAAQFEVQTLELPVTGGVHLAASGQITMLVGGEKHLFEKHEAAIRAMGERIFHMGPLGSASIIKVITNMLAFIHLVADGEALMLAKRAGLDLKQSWEAIRASSGNSFVHETEGALVLNGSYDVGFNMALVQKDLGFALGFGEEFGVPLNLAAATAETYDRAVQAYGSEAQSPMVVKLLEDALDTDLRADGFPARL